MTLCSISLPDLATHVIKLCNFFLINILHVGKSLDTNIELALQFRGSLHNNLNTLLYATHSFLI